MHAPKFKKMIYFSTYVIVSAYVLFAFLLSFEVMKTNNYQAINMIIEKVNNLFSIILIILLTSETIRFISRDNEDLIKNKNIKVLTKKENIKSIFKLLSLIIPFLAIKLVRFMFIDRFKENLPLSIQIVTIVFLVMSIIIISLILYIVISYIFKKNWLIENKGEVDLALWIQKYEPTNNENDECDQNNEIVFINLIKHFLAYTVKESELTFKSLKTKINKTEKMRIMPPLTN
ncbi:hypothetical protein MENTO_v1c05550 [Mesoplasma entomophilum]|uniref:Uncharacterized protein n=1 Tax=Mesoplasma entomophilum TaxID=2149 RepID=A0A3S5Y0E7_9MOLU|nr:hypothetical protein [Mesoplasma entomophilum]ATQ35689.1 hypothetical protein CS528_02870 [Mesoplasma entomophilum]ATZ19657.1 hypothetical protein MENTO_v1c05550 [Mesoplasma entomophilum]